MGRRRRGRGGPDPAGFLLVDKPIGPTSAAVVARVRKALGISKAGHTGTLDPLATGLLVVCVGAATRLVPFLTVTDKAYSGVVRLGVGTDTLDAEGTVVREDDPEAVAAVDDAAIERALQGLRGSITQRPPRFSAIRVGGRRLHELARAGEVVEAPVREVEVRRLEVTGRVGADVSIVVECSKGTYIRSLGRDLGLALGLGAHLVELRRTRNGAFSVDAATPLEAIEDAPGSVNLSSPAEAVAHLPTVQLDEAGVLDLGYGRARPFPAAPPGLCRALDPEGRLVGIVEAAGAEPARIVRGFPLT